MLFCKEKRRCPQFVVVRHVDLDGWNGLGDIQYLINTETYAAMQLYYSLQLLVNLICDEADADMGLDTFFREVEYWPCLQIPFCNAECPLDIPQAMILGDNVI